MEDFGLDPGAIFQCGRLGQLRFKCRTLALHPRGDRLHLAPALGDALGVAIGVSLRRRQSRAGSSAAAAPP